MRVGLVLISPEGPNHREGNTIILNDCPAGAGVGAKADPEEDMIRLAKALALRQEPFQPRTGNETYMRSRSCLEG